jgi:hypothetical protein
MIINQGLAVCQLPGFRRHCHRGGGGLGRDLDLGIEYEVVDLVGAAAILNQFWLRWTQLGA